MLSRTADHLFWMARYMERAENVARILQVGHRMASMARSLENPSNEWESTLAATGCSSRDRTNGTVRSTAVSIRSVRSSDVMR